MSHRNILIIKFLACLISVFYFSCGNNYSDSVKRQNTSVEIVIDSIQILVQEDINFSCIIKQGNNLTFTLEKFNQNKIYKDRGFIEINLGHLNDTILIDGYLKKINDVGAYVTKNYSYRSRGRIKKLATDHILIILTLKNKNDFNLEVQSMLRRIMLESSKSIQKIKNNYSISTFNEKYIELSDEKQNDIDQLIPIIFYINGEFPR